MAWLIAALKSLKKTEFEDFIKVFPSLSLVFSPTEPSISGINSITQRLWFRKTIYMGFWWSSKKLIILCKIPLRSNNHIIFWNPSLPSGHYPKKIDDGKWETTRSAHVQGNSRLWFKNSQHWGGYRFLQRQSFKFLEKYWFITRFGSLRRTPKMGSQQRILIYHTSSYPSFLQFKF